ncbi:MAG: DHH family phosphoesterase [Methanobrevibacter sp.]|uniref:single-stranded-DNA-specific exonuclease RecJ n=1 Tax=Methanobrevibacter sp. TaxID=66852 RepID=UPI0026E0095A|nr:DHH family phosphoesterase [Methanobrevibacter sp.]MDO5848699.1 DHH family phosphoesterase [Methanobrevibacter sp.]
MTELPESMRNLYKEAIELIEQNDDIKIYTHIDCDGLCSGAILSQVLDRLGKEHEIEWVNLDELSDLKINHDLTIFSDLGSGQPVDKNAKEGQNIIILDHHPPLRDLDYETDCNYIEINPLHHGIDGSFYVCGGGLCYFLARELGYKDLSWIGVLSAIGDIQNGRSGKLEGLNSTILKDAEDQGYIDTTPNDINIYGRKTRPLFVALSYFSDVKIPITGNQNTSKRVLRELNIDMDGRRTLSELSQEEKGKLFKYMLKEISKRVPQKYVKHVPKLLIGDAFEFLCEEEGTFLRDASEFSTAMNACGRNEKYPVAHKILKGDRGEALDCLEQISKEHRMRLAKNIAKVGDSIIELENLQYFDGKDMAPNIVGTVTGMILGNGNWKKPIIGFGQTDEDHLKVSLRCSKLLSYDGIHFGHIIREVSREFGGDGGGHSMACGAYIPIDKKDEFLEEFNNRLEGVIEN